MTPSSQILEPPRNPGRFTTPEAPADLFEQETAEIDVKPVDITSFEGSLDSREASGSLSLHLEAGPDTKQAALWILVHPRQATYMDTPMVPALLTDDGQNPGLYRWFDLDCDPERCQRDVTVNWTLLAGQAGQELSYSGLAFGGIGDGTVSEAPPTVTLEQ